MPIKKLTHYGRIKVLVPHENMMESLCVCPHCGSEVVYGEMCMYHGIHTCPNCIESLRKTVDFDRENQYDVYVRKGNNHEYEPYKYIQEEFITIEDAFKFFNGNEKVFDKDGYFIGNTYEKYAQKVADKFFNGNIDKLDKVCSEEHCFKEGDD